MTMFPAQDMHPQPLLLAEIIFKFAAVKPACKHDSRQEQMTPKKFKMAPISWEKERSHSSIKKNTS